VKPWHISPLAKSAQDLSIGVFRSRALRIDTRSSAKGRPTQRSVSRRPGRSIAASMSPGRFVAAMMYIPSLDPLIPSSSVSKVFTTRLEASERFEFRVGTKASNSSKKRTQGMEERARVNTWRIARSDSPTYCGVISEYSNLRDTLLNCRAIWIERLEPELRSSALNSGQFQTKNR
jgi:hypothetical protein